METQLAETMTQDDSARADGVTRRERFDDWIGVMRLNYQDRARTLALGYRYVGPKFRDELGYQERIGVTYRHAALEWSLFPREGFLQRVTPTFDALVLHDYTSRPEFTDLNPHIVL